VASHTRKTVSQQSQHRQLASAAAASAAAWQQRLHRDGAAATNLEKQATTLNVASGAPMLTGAPGALVLGFS